MCRHVHLCVRIGVNACPKAPHVSEPNKTDARVCKVVKPAITSRGAQSVHLQLFEVGLELKKEIIGIGLLPATGHLVVSKGDNKACLRVYGQDFEVGSMCLIPEKHA